MNPSLPIHRLTCSGEILWVRDAGQILIVDGCSAEAQSLRGVDAAVWSWLTLAYPYPQILRLLMALLASTPAEAELRLGVILQGWVESGLLKMEPVSNG